jgi:hypothetical protein
MNIKLTLLSAGIALSLGSVAAYAEENHLQEAIKHVMMAAKAKDGKSVAQHAGEAQKHAKIADEHLDAGLKSLEEAIDHGNQGHDDMAQTAAKEAEEHLKAAQ